MKLYSLVSLLIFFQFVLSFNEAEEVASKLPVSCNTEKIVSPPEVAANLLFQSKDGGRTWQDISFSLPAGETPEDFFAGESDVYLRDKKGMYRSDNNLTTPVWVQQPLDLQSSIAYTSSGTIAFNYAGQIYRQTQSGTWIPAYSNLGKHTILNVVELSDGTIFVGSDSGLYKSVDKGKTWKHVLNKSWVTNFAESNGVLIATGQKGIMRSTDNGENWEWVIREGGVGIAVERIKDGFAAIVYSERFKSRRIFSSQDEGKTWKAIDTGIPPSLSVSSIKQVGNYLLCGHPDGIFRSADQGKTWTLVHPYRTKNHFQYVNTLTSSDNDDGKVFTLYVSGGVVYAVVKDGGC